MLAEILKGKWNQLSGEARKKWGQLSDDDVAKIDGDMKKLKGIIQERYGMEEREAQKEIDEWLNKSSEYSDDINEEVLKGQWKKFTGELKEQWGKLSDDDLEAIDGNMQKLVGTLQEKYGYAKEEAKEKVAGFLEDTSEKIRS